MNHIDPTRINRLRYTWPALTHYYGDLVRALFLIVAIIIGLSIPLSGSMELGLLFGGPVIVILTVLAGYTNPHGKMVLIMDAIVAGLGVLLAETSAVASYAAGQWYAFAALEVVFVLFLVALYFSVKNVRAALSDKIGSIDGVGEFEEPSSLEEKR